MGITSLTDIRLRRRLNATENLKKCREAANRRCNERESTLVPALFPTRIPSLSLSAQPTPRERTSELRSIHQKQHEQRCRGHDGQGACVPHFLLRGALVENREARDKPQPGPR
eukprot:scaffold7997_cov126-Isochrysis_galbana.AAC.7